MKKYKITSEMRKKHKKFMNFLWITTWILFLPFVILEYIHDFVEKLLSVVATLRNKIVYGIMKLIFRKECELQQEVEEQLNREADKC